MIFRNDQVPDRAMSWIEPPSQVQLWDYLEQECVAQTPGCDAVVIPHNSNLSGGLMFETARVGTVDVPPEPVTAEEAKRRARWNTLFEVMQHKGSSECDSRLPVWSEDEYCNFEKMGYDGFGGKNTGALRFSEYKWLTKLIPELETPETRPPAASNFLRYALKKGLQQQAELGVNGFKFGFISSTDTHIAAPGLTMEKNHPGHGGAGMGARDEVPTGLPDELEYSPGGLAVLYAEENTRDSLFAAMQRREAYATVDKNTCEQSGGGHKQLCTMWQDNNFNAHAQAFYYTRVLETPSCRWSQRICAAAKVSCDDSASIPAGMENCCAPEHQKVIHERAWSSPIWYTPASSIDLPG